MRLTKPHHHIEAKGDCYNDNDKNKKNFNFNSHFSQPPISGTSQIKCLSSIYIHQITIPRSENSLTFFQDPQKWN
jgi:hypothetical protein